MKKNFFSGLLGILGLIVFFYGCSVNPADNTTTTTAAAFSAPELTIISPVNGSTNDGELEISGSAVSPFGFDVEGAGVFMLQDESTVPIRVGGEVFSNYYVSGLADGEHTFVFYAVDANMNLSVFITNQVFTINYIPDTLPPAVNVLIPTIDGQLFTNSVVISGTVYDDRAVEGVGIQLDEGVMETPDYMSGSVWSTSYSISEDSVLTNSAEHVVIVYAWDAAGNTNDGIEKGFTFTNIVDNEAPKIYITHPANDGVTFTNNITLSGYVTDNVGVVQVRIKIGSEEWQTLVLDETNGWSKSYDDLDSDYYTVTIDAKDGSGNMIEQTRSFQLDRVTGYDLFISEYADPVDTHLSDRYVEICNRSGAPIDLSNYKIVRADTGNANRNAWTNGFVFTNWSGILENGDVVVVRKELGDPVIASHADYDWEDANWDGDDAIGLLKTTNGGNDWFLVDAVGEEITDPGAAWAVAGVSSATKDRVLVRKEDVYHGNVDWGSSAGTGSTDSEWGIESDLNYIYCGANPGVAPDQLAPAFIVKAVDDLGGTSVNLLTSVDEDGDFYYVVLDDGSPVPDEEAMMIAPASITGYVTDGDIKPLLVSDGVVTNVISGLAEETMYDVYFLIIDNDENFTKELLEIWNTSNNIDVAAYFTLNDTLASESNEAWFTASELDCTNSFTGSSASIQYYNSGVEGKAASATSWNYDSGQKYFYFTLEYSGLLTLNELSFYNSRSATGPTNFAVYSGLDNYAAPLISGSVTEDFALHTIDLSAYSNISAPIEFRISGYEAPSTGSYRVDEIRLSGELNP